ncbi:retrovirus-related pol polyprotein from transposon TNT 1-94 [Tanacetum coccineum]
MHLLTKPHFFYDNTHKQALGYQNSFHLRKAQRIKPTLYDGSVIAKEHDVISVIDDEETLILEEESRSKMLDKQNDPISIKQKINISPIDYSTLNKIKEDFGKRFVTQKELIEAPSELPKVSLVNESLKKLKYQLVSFDKVVKKRTTSDAITVDEITEVQTVFNQMEAAVDQCSIDKNAFEIQIKQLSIDNDQLLNQIMSQEIVHIAASSVDILNVNKSCVDECNKCLELETKLLKKKDLIEKDVYDKLLKSYSTLEKHCISLELTTQLNKEIFKKDNFHEYQNDRIKSLSGKDSVENVKKDMDEIETINIELEHSVAKLLSENENIRKEREHLESIYKDQFDSIRKTRVQSKEHCDSLIAQINAKEKCYRPAVLKPSATIALGMFKLDIEPISHRLKNNRDAHEVYLEKTIENTDTLRGLVECTRKQNPSKPLLESACMFTQHVQELLVYVSKTCPSLTKPCEKLDAVTPMNKDKKVRFVKPVTSSSNIPKKNYSLRTKDSNKPLLTSTGVNTTTNASGSKPSGSIKKNRISRPPSNRSQFMNSGIVIISRVYYVEGHRHNVFSIGQFCDADLEVVFRKYTCFIRNLEGVDLLSGSRDTNLYTISLDDMLKTSPICLLSKASKTKSWKSKKSSHQPKAEDTNQEKLYLLHMDLCGPMHVESINEKKYILVIIDDYSRFTWVKILRSKDEAPDAIIKCIKNIQVRLNAIVRNVRTNNGTEFVTQTLRDFYENVGISHQTSVACTPQQNGVAKAINTACVEESPKTPHFHDDPLHESLHEDSTSQGSSSNVRPIHTPFESLEPKNLKQAMTEPSWIDAMQEEIHEFKWLQLWELVSCPDKVMLIKLKWIYKDNPSHVYKLKKALYGLKQAPRAWCDMLSSFLISQHFSKGAVDPTLFTQKARNDLLLAKPTEKHLNAVKRIFRYLKGTINMDIWYSKDADMSLTSYSDAYHAGCQDTRRSTSGSAQFLGDKLVSWSSKKQKSTAISSTEAEYIALSGCCAIALCCNNVQHSRAKHIDVRYHFIKEQVENRIVKLYFVRTEYQLADIFTKPLPRERFNFLIEKLGMRSMSPEMLKRLTEEEDE